MTAATDNYHRRTTPASVTPRVWAPSPHAPGRRRSPSWWRRAPRDRIRSPGARPWRRARPAGRQGPQRDLADRLGWDLPGAIAFRDSQHGDTGVVRQHHPWRLRALRGQADGAALLFPLRQEGAGPDRNFRTIAMAGGLATGASARQGEEGLPTPTRSCVIIALTAPEEAVRQKWWAIAQGSRGKAPAVRASGIARAGKMSGEAPEPLEPGGWV
jgi:hypothetical protein